MVVHVKLQKTKMFFGGFFLNILSIFSFFSLCQIIVSAAGESNTHSAAPNVFTCKIKLTRP